MVVWSQIRTVLGGMTLGILLLNLLIYRPVRRPATDRSDSGGAGADGGSELSARTHPALIELRRIAPVSITSPSNCRRPWLPAPPSPCGCWRAREEERRPGRELHDGLVNVLASIGAEAAFIGAGRKGAIGLAAGGRAIAAVTARMMETCRASSQTARWDWRFGLSAALGPGGGWRRRQADCVFELKLVRRDRCLARRAAQSVPDRQESLTNALRHGDPGRVEVDVRCDGAGCRLRVDDDGAVARGRRRATAWASWACIKAGRGPGGRLPLTRWRRGMRCGGGFSGRGGTYRGDDHDWEGHPSGPGG